MKLCAWTFAQTHECITALLVIPFWEDILAWVRFKEDLWQRRYVAHWRLRKHRSRPRIASSKKDNTYNWESLWTRSQVVTECAMHFVPINPSIEKCGDLGVGEQGVRSSRTQYTQPHTKKKQRNRQTVRQPHRKTDTQLADTYTYRQTYRHTDR